MLRISDRTGFALSLPWLLRAWSWRRGRWQEPSSTLPTIVLKVPSTSSTEPRLEEWRLRSWHNLVYCGEPRSGKVVAQDLVVGDESMFIQCVLLGAIGVSGEIEYGVKWLYVRNRHECMNQIWRSVGVETASGYGVKASMLMAESWSAIFRAVRIRLLFGWRTSGLASPSQLRVLVWRPGRFIPCLIRRLMFSRLWSHFAASPISRLSSASSVLCWWRRDLSTC